MSDQRCGWCLSTPKYIAYHDNEWGKPVFDDRTLFEFIVLESAQAGLSWITILNKREGYAAAFHNFDPTKVSQMTEKDIERLVQDTNIIRNKLKIKATITNAQAFLKIADEFGSFSTYYWQHTQGKPIVNNYHTLAEVPAVTDLATSISKDMKKRGFKFFGPTICYAYMQATGMVNDHLIGCISRTEIT
ncbi:DNA-3-methyladenine glycosylase I [Marinomonas sp. 2405UD68-3]|uniref:DNA-3-methyladenine glycosylase I n=1 Tax=Marinomonas sp. 2405UD68-3 TaxID=3391835 RepID=UPI0039C9262F